MRKKNGIEFDNIHFMWLRYQNGCVFTARNNISTHVNLIQTIYLDNYQELIPAGRAKATFRCRVGFSTYVHLTQMTTKHNTLSQSEAIGLRWQELLLS